MAGTPMTSTPAKISVQGVTKTFALGRETFTALDDVFLDIADNEFVTVVGPSGCGKSTLMNILAGLEEPTQGRALVDGVPVSGPGPERGVIFQQYALFPWLTVRQNVEFGLRTAGVSKAERRARAQRFIKLVGLDQFADALPKTLSGGMRQRCAIARAYAVDPSILLMDEPFGALDALTRVKLQEQLLDTWSKEKRTVMFITHDVDEAVFLANRVIVMAARPGRVYDVIEVPARTRDEEFRLSPEFADLRNRVWHSVYHQDGRTAATVPTGTGPAPSSTAATVPSTTA
jgi:NitT/TauT family transport system ATP-binding protein